MATVAPLLPRGDSYSSAIEESARNLVAEVRYPETDDEEDHVYAMYTRDFVERQADDREPLHRTWQQNILFLLGHQQLEYDSPTGTFTVPRKPKWKEKPVVNMLAPWYKHWVAKVTKERPVTTCVPASTDSDDIRSARLGDDVLKAKWQELRLSRLYRRALAWAGPTGNAVLLPYWNDDTGKIMPLLAPVEAVMVDDETGIPAIGPDGQMLTEVVMCPCDEDGNPKMREDGSYDLDAEPAYIDEGDVGVRVISPFHCYVNADAETEDDVREVVIIEPLRPEDFYRRFPDAPRGIVPDDEGDIERYEQLLTDLVMGAAGADTHFVGMETRQEMSRIRVHHYFGRPTPEFPKGRHWVTAGNELVVDPEPLPDGIWPVCVFMGDIDVPGQFWRAATMTQAIGLQREYNDTCAFIKEHHQVLLRGKWLVPIGSNIRRGAITSEPGEVIQHTPGLPPRQADIRPLPDEVYRERERIKSDFQLITGMFKISMGGQPPPGVTSGRAFLTMQEADDSDLGPFLHMLEDATAELAMLMLRIIQARYEEARLVRIAGDAHSYRVRAFKGADLTGIVDVEPQRGSAFPWSQVAKQDMLLQTARDVPQLFVDSESGQFDVEKFRRLLPVGGIGSLTDSGDEDISQAHREEEVFESWDPMTAPADALPRPMPWHNHVVHRREHRRVLNSAEFEKWPDQNKIAFIAHFQEHDAIVQQMMMAMQAAAAAQSAPPGDGGGPPPQ